MSFDKRMLPFCIAVLCASPFGTATAENTSLPAATPAMTAPAVTVIPTITPAISAATAAAQAAEPRATASPASATPLIVTTSSDEWRQAHEAMAQGDVDAAIAHMTRAISLDPRNAELYSDRGAFCADGSKPDQALRDYRMALMLDPTNARRYDNCAKAMLLLGETEQALVAAMRATTLDPGEGAYYATRAETYFRLARYDDALNDCASAIRLQPWRAAFYDQRGDMYLQLTQYPEAFADYQTALALDPSDSAALANRFAAFDGMAKDMARRARVSPQASLVYDRLLALRDARDEAASSDIMPVVTLDAEGRPLYHPTETTELVIVPLGDTEKQGVAYALYIEGTVEDADADGVLVDFLCAIDSAIDADDVRMRLDQTLFREAAALADGASPYVGFYLAGQFVSALLNEDPDARTLVLVIPAPSIASMFPPVIDGGDPYNRVDMIRIYGLFSSFAQATGELRFNTDAVATEQPLSEDRTQRILSPIDGLEWIEEYDGERMLRGIFVAVYSDSEAYDHARALFIAAVRAFDMGIDPAYAGGMVDRLYTHQQKNAGKVRSAVIHDDLLFGLQQTPSGDSLLMTPDTSWR